MQSISELNEPPHPFVDLRLELPGARFRIGYHRADNFTGAQLPGYGAPGAWLLKAAAANIASVNAEFHALGLGLVVYDAYRPRRATVAMVSWCETHGATWILEQGYASPKSRHNTGNTIDIGLWDLSTGEALDMGTSWDTFAPSSHTLNADGDVLSRRLLLRDTMKTHGWQGYSKEWWHFNLVELNDLPAFDVPYGRGEPEIG